MTNEAVLEADQPAAFKMRWHNYKNIKTQEEVDLIFRVPYEEFPAILAALGSPNLHDKVEVGFARLVNKYPPIITEDKRIRQIEAQLKATEPKGEHGDYARKLYTSGFFLHQDVLEALGTDEEFRKWIQTQPSCVSGLQDYVGMDSGEMKCEASHVERVHAGHGKGIKAPYCCVPLTHVEHSHRHQHGESGLLKYVHESGFMDSMPPDPMAWFWDQRCEYVTEWAKMRLKAELGYESLAYVSPTEILGWAEAHNLTNFLPQPRE